MSDEYPDIRDFQTYLENLLERNEARTRQYLTWLGSSITIFALLSWFALDLIQGSPDLQRFDVTLVLVTLLMLIYNCADNLLPEGFLGMFRTATSPWESPPNQAQLAALILSNLDLVRERAALSEAAALLTNIPLLIVWWQNSVANPGIADVALGVAVLRAAISLGALAFLLAFINEKLVKTYLKSVKEAERSLSRSEKLLLFFYKLWIVERLLSILVKLAFYGVFIVAVSWLLIQFGGPFWTEARLVAIALTMGVAVRFGYHTWREMKQLGFENQLIGIIRAEILRGSLKTRASVKKRLEEANKVAQARRFFPYKVPRP